MWKQVQMVLCATAIVMCDCYCYVRLVLLCATAIVMCDCCGIAYLEVKRPFSISSLSPLDSKAKLPFLVRREKDGILSLQY